MNARRWLRSHSLSHHILAPIWLRIPEKRRWGIVNWLNKSQRQCWCHLVDDALATAKDDACDVHLPSLRPELPRCADTCEWMHPEHVGEHECGCYCGKFRFTAADGPRERMPS